MLPILTASIICITLFSYVLSPRVRTVSGFFGGLSETGQTPTLWTIVLSQVTTWIFARSLLNAGILGYFYGLPGVLAYATYYLSFLTGARIMGSSTMILLNIALILSAVSTLDSTLSSAAKLSILGMGLSPATLFAGRTAMAAFMGLGLVLLFIGSGDLFDAVAISGTASLFLAPVVFFCIWRGWRVRRWAYLTAFTAAVLAAAVYFLESSSYMNLVGALAGLEHDYSKLLLLCLLALGAGCGAFVAGRIKKEERIS